MTSEQIKNYITTRQIFDDEFDTFVKKVVEYYKKYQKEYDKYISKTSLYYLIPWEFIENDKIKFYLEDDRYGSDIYISFDIPIELLYQSDLETEIAKFVHEEERKKQIVKNEIKKLELKRKKEQEKLDEQRRQENDEKEYERLKLKFEKDK